MTTGERVPILTDLERPIDLVLHPQKRYMYIANLGSEPCLLRADMDGKNKVKILAARIGLPVSMHLDLDTNTLYWADAKFGTIESMELSESSIMNSHRILIRSGLSHVMSLAIANNTVYWTDMDHGYLFHASLHDAHERAQLVTLPGHHNQSSIKKIKMVHESMHVELSTCAKSNGGCSHVCLLGESGPYCACPEGFLMGNDSRTCSKAVEACEDGEWKCEDGSDCILEEWRCDGHPDCNDHSDERNCSSCQEDKFACKSDGRCITALWRCDDTDDCDDGSDEANCTEHIRCAEDKFSCGQGQCIELAWRCDNKKDCANGHDEEDCTDADNAACQKDKVSS